MQYNQYSLGTEGKTFFILGERGTNVIVEKSLFSYFQKLKYVLRVFFHWYPFPFWRPEMGVLRGPSALPAVGSVTGTRALANISSLETLKAPLRTECRGPQDRPWAGPSRHLCSFVLLILQFLFLFFFSDFSTFSKCPAKLFKKKSSFSSFLMPSPLVLMVLIISWLGNGPPRRMGCRDPWDVHTGLGLTRLFCQNPFFTRSPTVLGLS